MPKPLIAIDIDDTVADSTEFLRLLVNQRLELNLPTEAYLVAGEYWGYYESIWREQKIDHLISYDDLNAEMIANVPMKPGAEGALRQLADKYSLIFITTRDKTLEPLTQGWFREHLPDIDFMVYFSSTPHNDITKSKGEICRELGVSLLIDDNADHCQCARREGVGAILFGEYGWQLSQNTDSLKRCRDWQAVLECLV